MRLKSKLIRCWFEHENPEINNILFFVCFVWRTTITLYSLSHNVCKIIFIISLFVMLQEFHCQLVRLPAKDNNNINVFIDQKYSDWLEPLIIINHIIYRYYDYDRCPKRCVMEILCMKAGTGSFFSNERKAKTSFAYV